MTIEEWVNLERIIRAKTCELNDIVAEVYANGGTVEMGKSAVYGWRMNTKNRYLTCPSWLSLRISIRGHTPIRV